MLHEWCVPACQTERGGRRNARDREEKWKRPGETGKGPTGKSLGRDLKEIGERSGRDREETWKRLGRDREEIWKRPGRE